jgi:hypothetical protein
METTAIRILKPNVTQQEAVDEFSAPGVAAIYWRMRSGPLSRIVDAYVPYWVYRVRYQMARAPQERLFALDAVDGSLDLFEFPRAFGESQFHAIQTRNQLPPALTESRAEDLLREKVLRVVFQQGFFKLREPRIEAKREPCDFYLPYWLGLYGGLGVIHCRVMDAVRRRMEGAKASAFFEGWLAA